MSSTLGSVTFSNEAIRSGVLIVADHESLIQARTRNRGWDLDWQFSVFFVLWRGLPWCFGSTGV